MSTQDLYKGGKQLPVYLSPGSVVTFKSTLFDLSVLGFQTSCLDLYNDIGDIALRITLRGGQNKIFCNDYTSNLQRGWGKERSADLDVNWQSQGATISVYYFLTDSKLTRYQILVNLTTVCYFDSRLRGPLVQLGYLEHPLTLRSILSNPLRVVCCAMLDLQPEERRAIQSGGASLLEIPAADSTAISIRPSHFIPNQTYASIGWDDGKEIRIYHLGQGHILQEYAYSEIKDRNRWHYGSLHTLKIFLDPTSSITAVRHKDDGICIYYQDPNDGFIRTLRQSGPTGEWRNDPDKVARAVKGSSIAVIMDDNGPSRYRVYYQEPELHLREQCRGPSVSQWLCGDFNPGVQPRGTPITAEVVHGGDVDINVTWRDARGRVASASWSKSSSWDLPDTNDGGPLDGRD